jgi:N6-L-threonylcarbamoyladenine synthase
MTHHALATATQQTEKVKSRPEIVARPPHPSSSSARGWVGMMAMSLMMTTVRSATTFVGPSNCRTNCRWAASVSSFATAPQSIEDAANNDDTNEKAQVPKQNKKKSKKGGNKLQGKEKRRQFIGMAKAVDRGQWTNVYKPGGDDGTTFTAQSGLPDRTRPFTVLGIESSCDDTGAAVVRSDGTILGESLASQNDIHEEWGGIVPGLAKNAHEEKIDEVIEGALRKAGMESVDEVDAIGVTVGPGLEICLRVGCNRARDLAMQYNKPFVGVHHLEAHILMARLPIASDNETKESFIVPATEGTHESVRSMEFPFLALLVSGGHCQLLKCIGIGQYTIIGGTLDDSLGEAFDKTARLLGLPVGGGGGPAVEKLAREGDPKAVQLPIPLQKRKDCDFSYAGLKTAVRSAAEKLAVERGVGTIDELSRDDKANIAASFQNVAIRHIEQRLDRAMTMLEGEDDGIRSLAVVGGVAANTELRTRLEKLCNDRHHPWKMFVPPPRLCTDQGSMSAWAAIERLMKGSSDQPKGHEVYARYPFQFKD